MLENFFQIFGMASVFQEFLQLINVSPRYSFFVCQNNNNYKIIKLYIYNFKIFLHENTKIKPISIEIVLESTFLFFMKFHQMLHKKQW